MTTAEYEVLTDEYAELCISHAPADDPEVIRVCCALRREMMHRREGRRP